MINQINFFYISRKTALTTPPLEPAFNALWSVQIFFFLQFLKLLEECLSVDY